MKLELPSNFGELPDDEKGEWVRAAAQVAGMNVPDNFGTLSGEEILAWMEAHAGDLQDRIEGNQKQAAHMDKLLALIAPITEGRPSCTVEEALLILEAEKHLDRPLRTLTLTELARLTARTMMQSTVQEIEPEGGREKATAIFEGARAEMFARGVSERHAKRLVERQGMVVLAESAMKAYSDAYARQGLEARVRRYCEENGIPLAG